MHTVEIPKLNYKGQFPSNIDEMTTKQFIYFCKLISLFQRDLINHNDFKLFLLINFLNLKFNPKVASKHPLSLIQSVNLYLLTEQLDSFFEEKTIEGKQCKNLKLGFTRNLIPALRTYIFQRKLHGPAEYLTNVRFFEYIEAQRHFIAFSKTQKYTELDEMIACLYRPAKWFHFILKYFPNYDGDIRQKFNENHVSRRAKQISKLAPEVRFGIYLFFRNCEETIQTGELDINGTTISFRDLYKKSDNNQGGINLGWVGILYSLAESGVFGSIKETASQNLYDVMLRVYQVIKDDEKVMAKYGKSQTIS